MMFVSFSEPDLSADGNYEVRYKCNVLIYSGGEVLWVPPAIYQVRNLDYTNSLNRNNRTERNDGVKHRVRAQSTSPISRSTSKHVC